jgi:hypothetical protein
MALSRERAVDLSHRIVERLTAAGGIGLAAEKEFSRNRILQALLEWDRQSSVLEEKIRKKLRAKGGRLVEGSREWDLLFGEEIIRAYEELVARGE